MIEVVVRITTLDGTLLDEIVVVREDPTTVKLADAVRDVLEATFETKEVS